MNADFLWTAIVPLALLAIWALTAITNRDPKPTPGRSSNANPYAQRPQGPAPMNRTEIRWAPPASKPPPPAPRPGGQDDDIVIIEPGRPMRTASNTRTTSSTKRNRSKQGSKGAGDSSKPLLASVSQAVNQQVASSLVIKPLLESTVTDSANRKASAVAAQPIDMERAGPGRFAAAFADRNRLRDAIILNELLQPPLALRHKQRNG